jgi:DNA-binding SARP family transcriptional activator
MEFRILGPVEVREGSRPLPISGAKERAVLAFLLLHANQLVPADRIIEEIWGAGTAAETGRKSLRVRVSELRKALGPGGRFLVARTPGYLLELEPDQLDLLRFERLVGEAAGAEPTVASAKLREALDLWQGPALADFTYDAWASLAIGRLEEIRLAALERRVEADLALGRHVELIGELEMLSAEHPLRERLRGLLMLALYRSGRQAEALDVFHTTRRALVEGLGIEPSKELRGLEKAILTQDSSLDLAALLAPDRSIIVAPRDERSLAALLALGEPMASLPPRELILAGMSAAGNLGRTAATLNERREALLSRGVPARAAAFTSTRPGSDLVRLAAEQDVDLLLVDAGVDLLDDIELQEILRGAPCDVAVFVGRDGILRSGPVLVPFTGADHDWSAVEIAAWIARAENRSLRLAGPVGEGRDASRSLARASLAVQRALEVAAEPLLVEPGARALVSVAEDAALVVVGLSERWQTEGLGPVRLALAREARPPILLVRRGLRPGGLAPSEAHTRFTWSVGLISP